MKTQLAIKKVAQGLAGTLNITVSGKNVNKNQNKAKITPGVTHDRDLCLRIRAYPRMLKLNEIASSFSRVVASSIFFP
jgi:hypothetical protein